MRNAYSAADLHVHTTASDGTATPGEVVEWTAQETDLKVIAICDHNTNEGALEAASLAPRYGIEVVVGQEVESTQGHILGLWTPKMIDPGMDAVRTVSAIHSQGGVAIVAHPYAPTWWHNFGLCRGDTAIYDAVDFDAVEVANSTPLLFFANFRARRYWNANATRLAATGGSDAHMLSVIGTSRTLFLGSTADELRTALDAHTTRGWGPSFNPLRAFTYARKVRQIQQRDRERKLREEARGLSTSCDSCARCAPEEEAGTLSK